MLLRIKHWFVGDYLAKSTDFYEKARINLSYNFFFPFALILIFVAVVFTFTGAYTVMAGNLCGAAACLLHLVLLKKLHDVRLASKIHVMAVFCIVMGNILFDFETLHLGTPLWLVILILFTVFTLGIRWGIGIATACVLGYAYYFAFNLRDHYRKAAGYPDEIYHTLFVEIALAFGIILYLVSVYVYTSSEAKAELRKSYLDLQQKNEVISRQHAEKEVMMREIHHRVKNNLQVIVSLLRLQSQGITDKRSVRGFEDAQQRILAMSLVHERMYRSEDLSNIEVKQYFELLAHDLVKQNITTQEIDLNVNVDLHHIGHRSIIPMGLILNEMIVNSLKHGIGDKGTISITASQAPSRIHFSYSDNGSGFSETSTEGFGLELIRLLTSQLNGEVSICSNPGKGTEAVFSFPHLN